MDKKMEIPFLLNHDNEKIIGYMRENNGQLMLELTEAGKDWLDSHPNTSPAESQYRHGGATRLGGMMKRLRAPKAKAGELLVKYGRDGGDEDLFYCYPDNNCGMKRDSKLLMLAFERTAILQEDGRNLRQELEARGYDITTLKFSIMKKADAGHSHPNTSQAESHDLRK